MRKILFSLSLIFILLSSFHSAPIFANEVDDINIQDNESSNSNLTSVDSNEAIRVGYYESYTAFADDINSLNNKGYGVEIFEKIEEVSDLTFEYIAIEGDSVVALQEGEVDLVAFFPKTEDRANQVLYSQLPFSKTYAALMTNDSDLIYADFDSIKNRTVATFEDNVANERLNTMVQNLGFTVDYVYGDFESYGALDTDFVLGFSEHRMIRNYNNVLDVGVYNYYLNASLENQELLDKIDAIFYDIIITEGNFFMELEEKYTSQNVEMSHRGLMVDELETLRQRPLEVGYIADYEPISFTNEDGEPDGSMVDILNFFADRYDFDVHYYPYSLDDPYELRANYDILLTLYGNGESEWENYVLTESFYNMPLYAQVNYDLYEGSSSKHEIMQTNPRIGTLPYQTVDFDSFNTVYPEATFVFFKDWYELLDSFAAGEIDMMLSTESSMTFAELYLNDTQRVTISTDTEVPMQFLMHHSIADEYLPIFNVMTDRITKAEYNTIVETNANEFLPQNSISYWQFFISNWYYFVIILFIVLAFVGIREYFQQKRQKLALQIAYESDSLTGLMTTNKFRTAVDDALKSVKTGECEILSFDIDMFKTLNTHFSITTGTLIIVAIADALKKAFKDTNALIARDSSDHFIIFRHINEGGSIQEIYTSYILPSIEKNINEKYKVSLSFGNVIIDDINETSATLIGQADNARAQGKSVHKTTFLTFDEQMRKQYDDKINITFRMEHALKEREFVIEYQPKMNFESLRISGAEALVRWHPKQGNKIYPDEFIPIFEENGFISYLDLHVLDVVCEFIKTNQTDLDIPCISVNLSAKTILEDNIVERIIRIISSHNIVANKIEFELTETAIEDNTVKFLETVKQLKSYGFIISIDDFGAGVSSLNRLAEVDADILKLDKVFFNLKDQGAKSLVVVTDVINMAKHLNMKVVAEGVETQEQAAWLKTLHCDYAQGYYFARPMSDVHFLRLLTENKEYKITTD